MEWSTGVEYWSGTLEYSGMTFLILACVYFVIAETERYTAYCSVKPLHSCDHEARDQHALS